MHIPDHIARSVLDAPPQQATVQANRFGTDDNVGLVFLVNSLGLYVLCEWLKVAIEHHKANGDTAQVESIRSFMDNLVTALQARPWP